MLKIEVIVIFRSRLKKRCVGCLAILLVNLESVIREGGRKWEVFTVCVTAFSYCASIFTQ